MELFDLLQTLACAYGPSGDEAGVRETIAGLARPHARDITTDTLGNLIVHRPGPGPRVLLAAHMDSIGFIVTHIEEEGFLRAGRLGGVVPREAAYTPVRFQSGLLGVFLPEEKADLGKLKLDECYLDVGARSAREAGELVRVGDTAVYHAPCFRSGDNVTAAYLDNRAGCAVLLAALEQVQDSPNDLYFLFSVQEEVGLRGARTAAWALEADYALAVDVTDVDDTPGSEKSGTVGLGRGAGIKVMDSSVICHPAVVERLEECARAQGIPAQRDILRAGGTDAGAIHTTRTGVRTGGVSLPCRHVHTPVETASLADLDACVRLTAAFANAKLEKL